MQFGFKFIACTVCTHHIFRLFLFLCCFLLLLLFFCYIRLSDQWKLARNCLDLLCMVYWNKKKICANLSRMLHLEHVQYMRNGDGKYTFLRWIKPIWFRCWFIYFFFIIIILLLLLSINVVASRFLTLSTVCSSKAHNVLKFFGYIFILLWYTNKQNVCECVKSLLLLFFLNVFFLLSYAVLICFLYTILYCKCAYHTLSLCEVRRSPRVAFRLVFSPSSCLSRSASLSLSSCSLDTLTNNIYINWYNTVCGFFSSKMPVCIENCWGFAKTTCCALFYSAFHLNKTILFVSFSLSGGKLWVSVHSSSFTETERRNKKQS